MGKRYLKKSAKTIPIYKWVKKGKTMAPKKDVTIPDAKGKRIK